MALLDPQLHPELEASINSLKIVDAQSDLDEKFRFDLSDHILQDPETSKGFVSSVYELSAVEAFGHVVPVKEVRVVDPFVAADPYTYEKVRNHVQQMEDTIRSHGYDPLVERRQRYPYSQETDSTELRKERRKCNQYTQAWLNDPNVAPLKAWHGLIPSAVALGHLTQPWLDRSFDIDNTVMPTTQETTAHLRFVDDAIGIRNRAVAMEYIAGDHLSNMPSGEKNVIQWLDLASGTAEPAISAAKQATDEQGLDITLTVVDHDANALSFVKSNAEEQGFDGQLNIIEDFITAPAFIDRLEHKDDGYDVVENLGFEEYLPERDLDDGLGSDEVGAFKDISILPNASEFTKTAFDLVKPGGVLISGNMVLERPQRNFVFGVVNWPIINARSEEAILRVYKRAGILDDPNASIEIFRVTDDITDAHIYDIVKVTKHKIDNHRTIHLPSEALGLSA